jgi:O-antigen ligase
MTWLACLLLLAIGLVWRRSKWIWVLPMVPIGLYVIAPDAVRSRAASFLNLGYYSNAERLQMIEVGWRMVQDRPLTGVGPGRVEELYTAYLKPGEPVPAYRGHLHNNMAQIAAMFGIPVTLAALLFVAFAFRDLIRARRKAFDPDSRFLSDTAVLALIGFLFAGLFEYTYGHALGLIMIAFAVFPALSVGDLDYEMRSKDAGLLTFNRSRSSPASDH